jgi:23S rRNA (cytidine2498-2'-O)-methyltransferase
LLCRVGFEPDLIDELRAWYAARSVVADIESTQEAVVRVGPVAATPQLADLVFARDLLVIDQELTALDVKDRVTPIGRALDLAGAFSRLAMLTPDSESTKPLAPLLTALEARLRNKASAAADAQAAIWMLSGTHALVGHPPADGGAQFIGGIPRLKFPRGAPSRSTLKLDEAFQVLLGESERAALLRPGMTAVDLGAAPGGWTFQLVMRQMRVTAIDNGRVDAALMASGLVTHLREDGFRYRPTRPVDWLVCDMVETPGRVAELVARWFASGWCRAAVFNLKLPMKRRFEAWTQARSMLEPLARGGFRIRARQLYHDREEITVAVVPMSLRAPSAGAGLARDPGSLAGKRNSSRAKPAATERARPAATGGAKPAATGRAKPTATGRAKPAGAPRGGRRSRTR